MEISIAKRKFKKEDRRWLTFTKEHGWVGFLNVLEEIPALERILKYEKRIARLLKRQEVITGNFHQRGGQITELKAERDQLRKWMWLHHGCGIASLYGDDGEMQCNSRIHRSIDFKRDPVERIIRMLAENDVGEET